MKTLILAAAILAIGLTSFVLTAYFFSRKGDFEVEIKK